MIKNRKNVKKCDLFLYIIFKRLSIIYKDAKRKTSRFLYPKMASKMGSFFTTFYRQFYNRQHSNKTHYFLIMCQKHEKMVIFYIFHKKTHFTHFPLLLKFENRSIFETFQKGSIFAKNCPSQSQREDRSSGRCQNR